MKNIFYFLFLIPLMFACEKDANIDIPDSKPQLVVASFVSPNSDTLRLKLSWSLPIYYQTGYQESKSEPGASVIVTHHGTQYTIPYDAFAETYIYPGINLGSEDVVDLKINLSGQEEITAQSTIPTAPNYLWNYEGSQEITYSDGYVETQHEFKFTGLNTAPTNYYRISAIGYYHSVNDTYVSTLYSNTGEFFALSENQSITLKYYEYKDYYYTLDSIKTSILHTDEAYYKYHLSVQNQYYGDGIFTEPTVIYNNVSSGLGVFSSYNMKTVSTIIP